MFLREFAELVLLVTTVVAGTMWWQLRKRKALVKKIVTQEAFLKELISKDAGEGSRSTSYSAI
jgi:hypothetical protein